MKFTCYLNWVNQPEIHFHDHVDVTMVVARVIAQTRLVGRALGRSD